MKQPQMRARLWGSLFGALLLSVCLVPTAWAQRRWVQSASPSWIPAAAVASRSDCDPDGHRHERRPERPSPKRRATTPL